MILRFCEKYNNHPSERGWFLGRHFSKGKLDRIKEAEPKDARRSVGTTPAPNRFENN